MIIYNSLPSLDTRDIKRSISRGSVNIPDVKMLDESTIISNFDIAMSRASKLFGKHAFRKSYGTLRRRPINKSLFECWGVLLANMSIDQYARLCVRKKQFIDEYSKLLDDNKFIIAISRDSMRQGSVAYRYDELSKLINKYSL